MFKSEVFAPVIVAVFSLVVIAIGCIMENNWSMAYISYPLIILGTLALMKYLSHAKKEYFDARKRVVDEFLKG